MDPSSCFPSALARHGLAPLRRAAPATLQVNVGKRCDLELPLGGRRRSVWDVATGSHCHACTAGAGSSCGGALA